MGISLNSSAKNLCIDLLILIISSKSLLFLKETIVTDRDIFFIPILK